MEATNNTELFTDLSQEQSETVQGGCYGWRGGWGGGYYRPVSYYRPYYYAPRAYYGYGYGCRRWYY